MTLTQTLVAQGYHPGTPYTRPDGVTITPWYRGNILLVQDMGDGTQVCYAPVAPPVGSHDDTDPTM